MANLPHVLPLAKVALNNSTPPEQSGPYSEFSQEILNGTYTTRDEILTLVKNIGLATGEKAYFSTIDERLSALQHTIGEIADTNSPVKAALLEAFYSLMFMKDFNKNIVDQITNPTVENGGESIFEEDLKTGIDSGW